MIIFRKAKKPAQALNDLDAYISGLGYEPIKLLEREISSWGEISYEELAAIIESGRYQDFIDWRERYAKVVNEILAPLWLGAIEAASRKATRGKIILYDSHDEVKEWLKSHGGELISQISDQSRRAVINVIEAGIFNRTLPKVIAQQVRPLIGLTNQQAQQNLNYRAKVYQQYLTNGASEATAQARADKAAIKYAAKQHRFRAETIVLTETAFAYNKGADMGIRRAINAQLMGRCEMIWTTAGVLRTCGRCLELRGKVVGYTDEVGVQIPPLHPRCRCAIMYRETVETVKPNPKTVGECKNFGELETFWRRNYNAAVAGSLENLDFAATKEACTGFEAAMNLIPSTRQYLKELKSAKGKGWLYRYVYEDCAVEFNQALFLPEEIIGTREAIARTSAIVRNSTIKSMAAHEMGHAANLALAHKVGLSGKNIDKIGELFVKDVFNSLPKEERAAGFRTLCGRISKLLKYAQQRSETLPEALNDFVANGANATAFSKALVNQIEVAISGEEFVLKYILSQDYQQLRKQFGWASLDDVTVRKWYNWHDKRIHDLIDQTLTLEEKAHRAFDLRNEYRTQARDLMLNQKLRRALDETHPNPTWEGKIAEKMHKKGLTREEAIADIYETAMKTNPEVNRKLGLE